MARAILQHGIALVMLTKIAALSLHFAAHGKKFALTRSQNLRATDTDAGEHALQIAASAVDLKTLINVPSTPMHAPAIAQEIEKRT